MPPVVAAIGLGAAAGAASATIAAGGIAAVTTTALVSSALLGAALSGLSLLLAPKPPKVGTSQPETTSLVTSEVQPAEWMVGRARVGGLLVFYKERKITGGHQLNLVIVFSEGACDSIEKIWIDGEEVRITRTPNSNPAWGTAIAPVVGSEYSGKITIHECFAGDGTQGASLRSISGIEWTAEHKLTGKSFVHAQLFQPHYDRYEDRFWDRFPALNFLVKGIKITWPGQTTAVWTENAAALRYWWETVRRGRPAAAINNASVMSAYTLCDQDISLNLPAGYGDYPSTSKRYSINGVVRAGDDPLALEREFDYAWQGHVVDQDGILHFRPGMDRVVTKTITDDDIMQFMGASPAPSLEERVNAATVALSQSREHDWLKFGLPELKDDAAITRDGEKRSKDLGERAFVADPMAAGRLLAIQLRRARAYATYKYRVRRANDIGYYLSVVPGDWMTVTDAARKLDELQVLVVSATVEPDWSVTFDVIYQPDGIYDDTLVLPGLKGTPVSIPSIRVVSAPTNLTAASSFLISRDGRAVWHIDVSWDDTPHVTRIYIKSSDQSDDQVVESSISGTTQRFTVDSPGTYVISAYNINRADFASAATETTITFGWADVPMPAPIIIASEQYGVSLHLVANAITHRDVAGIEVRYTRGEITGTGNLAAITESGWLAAARADVALVAPIAGNQPLVANIIVPSTGRYRLFCRLFNHVGNYGPITEIGYKRIVIPAIETISPQQWPLWTGTLNNLYLWDHDNAYRLVPDYDARDDLTKDQLDGSEGWPFGQVEGYNVSMSDANSTYYETEVIDLGEQSNVDVICNIETYEAPNPDVTTETGHDFYAYYGLTNDRSAMTQVTISGNTTINAVRYIAFRVHLKRWRGAALTRFSPQVRRLQ